MPIAGGMFSDHCVVLLENTHLRAEQGMIESLRRECLDRHQNTLKSGILGIWKSL